MKFASPLVNSILKFDREKIYVEFTIHRRLYKNNDSTKPPYFASLPGNIVVIIPRAFHTNLRVLLSLTGATHMRAQLDSSRIQHRIIAYHARDKVLSLNHDPKHITSRDTSCLKGFDFSFLSDWRVPLKGTPASSESPGYRGAWLIRIPGDMIVYAYHSCNISCMTFPCPTPFPAVPVHPVQSFPSVSTSLLGLQSLIMT